MIIYFFIVDEVREIYERGDECTSDKGSLVDEKSVALSFDPDYDSEDERLLEDDIEEKQILQEKEVLQQQEVLQDKSEEQSTVIKKNKKKKKRVYVSSEDEEGVKEEEVIVQEVIVEEEEQSTMIKKNKKKKRVYVSSEEEEEDQDIVMEFPMEISTPAPRKFIDQDEEKVEKIDLKTPAPSLVTPLADFTHVSMVMCQVTPVAFESSSPPRKKQRGRPKGAKNKMTHEQKNLATKLNW
jgi:hypothetical protein